MDIRKANQPKTGPQSGIGPERGTIPYSGSMQEVGKATKLSSHEQLRARQQAAPIRDRIELSETAQIHVAQDVHGDRLRESLVKELKGAYQDGSLNSRTRIEKAAAQLLS